MVAECGFTVIVTSNKFHARALSNQAILVVDCESGGERNIKEGRGREWKSNLF